MLPGLSPDSYRQFPLIWIFVRKDGPDAHRSDRDDGHRFRLADSWRLLAFGTVVGSAGGHPDFPDRGSTLKTWFVRPAVNRRKPVNGLGAVVDDLRAALGNSFSQHWTNRSKNGPHLVWGKAIGSPTRMHLCLEQHLINVDVAQSRDHSLVQQKGFNGYAAMGK